MVDSEEVPKGLKQILGKRGLWIEKLKNYCKARDVSLTGSPDCCTLHRMAAQPDFKAQKSILYEALGKTRHTCDILPNFHCELAPIENYWGFAKTYTRTNCDYSISALRKTVPLSLEFVPIFSIRKFSKRAAHLTQAYAKDYSYKLTMFAHKKYRSHRQILEGKIEPKLKNKKLKIFETNCRL